MASEYSITASAPLAASSGASYTEKLMTTGERYTVTEFIGYNTATLTLSGDPEYLKSWFGSGLGRHVVWRAPDGSTAWEGYVSEMVLSLGDRARTKSIEDMYNRVILVYTALDTTSDPPVAGAQATSTLNDTDSQALYGIKSIMLSGGECTAATAADDCLAELRKRRVIQTGERVSTGRGKYPTLQVKMLGYAHMINWTAYTASGDTGTQSSSTLVVAVLAAEANGIASTSAVDIYTCTTAMPKVWDGRKNNWDVVKECATRGYESGGDAWPWTCGVYEGRRVVFKQAEGITWAGLAETTNQCPIITYHPDRAVYIEDGGRELRDWEIRPDRLVRTYGLSGNMMYVAQVQWQAGLGVVLDGRNAQNPMRTYPRQISSDSLDTLRAFTFVKDRDVKLQGGRVLVLGDDTEVTASSLVPIGAVVFWPSTAGAIPSGWSTFAALQGRFPVGADGATFVNGATGGAETINIRHDHGDTDSGGAHTHASGTYATDSDAHTHGPGTLATDSDAHTHAAGTYVMTGHAQEECQAGTGKVVASDAYTHVLGGLSASDSHSHDVDSGATASDSHSHDVTGSSASDGSHTHNIPLALSSTQSILPPYLVGTWIQRTT